VDEAVPAALPQWAQSAVSVMVVVIVEAAGLGPTQ
jgi:hypothetical protein